MSFDLGDTVPLSVTITNTDGVLANATSVTLNIDLPDGTILAVGTVSPASTGIYNYDYIPTLYVRHNARWLATGTNAGAFTDSFYVEPSNDAAFISLEEFKNHVGIVGNNNDEKIRGFITAACQMIADRMGQIVPLVVTEDRETDCEGRVSLYRFPIINITSVKRLPGLTTIPQRDNSVSPAFGWLLEDQNGIINVGYYGYFRFSYIAGRQLIPENFILAAKELTAHLWRTSQQNASTSTGRPAIGTEPMVTGQTSYALPYSVRQLLGLDKRPQRGVFVG